MRTLAGSVALAVSLVCLSLPAAASVCPPGHNLADVDFDGLPDYACVGDWDGSGTCEMLEDIQAAIDMLTDPGPKFVQLDDCDFAAPAVAPGLSSIIELPSFITIAGAGDATVLNGFDASDVTSTQAVISNVDHLGGNSNIVIRDLAIDGGWEDGDATGLSHARMGVRFTACHDCEASNLSVHDTLHACLYASNSTEIRFLDSTLQRCGNYSGEGSTFPCVYLYAVQNNETRDVLVAGNECHYSGSSAYSTRRGTTNAILTDIVYQDNVATHTRPYEVSGIPKACFKISGVGGAQYFNNTCANTSGLANVIADGYYSDGTEINASANIYVDGLYIFDSGRQPPIQIRHYAENFTLRNVTVSGAEDHCLAFETPLRNFSVDGGNLVNCGGWGIQQLNDAPSGAAPDETLSFEHLDIVNVGLAKTAEGAVFHGPTKGLVFNDVKVSGATSHGVSFEDFVEDTLLSNLDISSTAGSGLILGGGSRNAVMIDNSISNTGSDCITFLGNGAAPASHEFTQIDNSTLSSCGGHGIAVAPAGELAVQDFVIEDTTIDGTQWDGIELLLSEDPSLGVALRRNWVRDFGKAVDGSDYDGIEIAGNLSGEEISDNILEDLNGQGAHGVYYDVAGSDLDYMCSNECLGTIPATECLLVTVDPNYGSDVDHDQTVDACDDDDDDGVIDIEDNCVGISNPLQLDSDEDEVGDACDNCVHTPNPEQYDFDVDSEGDLCDLDDDLIYVLFDGADDLSWQPEQPYRKWNVYRGDLDVLVGGGSYTQPPFSNPLAWRECTLNTEHFHDKVRPQIGKTAFYLVTGITTTFEGGLGTDGDGNDRPNDYPCSWTGGSDPASVFTRE